MSLAQIYGVFFMISYDEIFFLSSTTMSGHRDQLTVHRCTLWVTLVCVNAICCHQVGLVLLGKYNRLACYANQTCPLKYTSVPGWTFQNGRIGSLRFSILRPETAMQFGNYYCCQKEIQIFAFERCCHSIGWKMTTNSY